MQVHELVTQYKLCNITLSMIHLKRNFNSLEKFLRKVGSGGKDTVNPFLTHMYYRISFLAWYNMLLRHERDEELS